MAPLIRNSKAYNHETFGGNHNNVLPKDVASKEQIAWRVRKAPTTTLLFI
jgi:hypothetical protein